MPHTHQLTQAGSRIIALALSAVAAVPASAQPRLDVRVELGGAQVGIEVLTRGPVHEAFAQAVDLDLEPPQLISRPPPQQVEEWPPEQTFDGLSEEAEWVPGYWSWDEERNDYLWVSGIWRVPPPGHSWVPGYWDERAGGYEFTQGLWLPDDDDEIEYLPTPPASIEEGPPGPPPTDHHVWIPGTWYWEDSYGWEVDTRIDPRTGREVRAYHKREAGYGWRPGYWIEAHPDWVWIPAQYVWSRRGYIFVDGRWDYALERRGLLFAPVRFEQPIYTAREYRYSPTVLIDVNILTEHLFTRTRTAHYYFGDYYAPEYANGGYYPWFESHRRHRSYDPLYVHLRWRNSRNDDRWEGRLSRHYAYRRANPDARPARSYQLQKARVETASRQPRPPGDERDADVLDGRKLALARPSTGPSDSGGPEPRVKRLTPERREEFAKRGQALRDFKEKRKQIESAPGVAQAEPRSRPERPPGEQRPPEATPTKKSERVRIERSPVTSRSPEARSKAPKRPAPPEGEEPRKKRAQRARPDKEDDKKEKRDKKDKDNDNGD